METSRTNPRAIIALLLAVAGLGAAPASARAQKPRLLFLGISKDGKAHPAAESAVRLRLAGLEVEVVQPQESTEPLCERAECLTTLLSRERADLALTGRILKNERACLATLWFAAGQDKGKMPAAQDIACRPDGKDSELTGSLADGAAAMVDSYLQNRTPTRFQDTETVFTARPTPKSPEVLRNRWNWKRKTALAGLGILLAVGIIGTGYFGALNNMPVSTEPTYCPDSMELRCQQVYDYRIQTAISGALTSASAVSLLFVAIR